MAYEAARILLRLGADVRVFNPSSLPMKDGVSEKHEKVVELRAMSEWSDGHFWCSPEQHGTVTAVFKTQIDWIPLSSGSVRPTQGRTLAVCQINGALLPSSTPAREGCRLMKLLVLTGGSQSFNT
jgi:arsenic resistance protein ArsH